MATKKDEAKNEVAVVEAGGLPADMAAELNALGTGFENMRPQDYIIPYFSILQGLSPQMRTVDGAKLGLVINTTTNELFNETYFVGVKTQRQFVRWKPNRGGFVAAYPDETHPVVAELRAKNKGDEFAKLITSDGDEVQETYYATGLQLDEQLRMIGFGRIAFKSTQIKKFKAWMTFAQNQLAGPNKLKLFDVGYRIKSSESKNTKGEFYSWDIAPAKGNALASRLTDPAAYKAIIQLLKADIAIDHEAEGRAGAAAGDTGDAASREM